MSYIGYIMLRYDPSIPNFFRTSIMKGYFINGLFCYLFYYIYLLPYFKATLNPE